MVTERDIEDVLEGSVTEVDLSRSLGLLDQELVLRERLKEGPSLRRWRSAMAEEHSALAVCRRVDAQVAWVNVATCWLQRLGVAAIGYAALKLAGVL